MGNTAGQQKPPPLRGTGTYLTRNLADGDTVIFDPAGTNQTSMGQAVIGGVITSSLLTLVVVPVVYCYMDDLAQWIRRFMGLEKPTNPQDLAHPQ